MTKPFNKWLRMHGYHLEKRYQTQLIERHANGGLLILQHHERAYFQQTGFNYEGKLMIHVKQHLDMLGFKARDKVTRYSGVITSVGFDLYGCIQVILNPGLGADGKLGELLWFDIARVEVIDDKRVMQLPNFELGSVAQGKKGPAEKPAMLKP